MHFVGRHQRELIHRALAAELLNNTNHRVGDDNTKEGHVGIGADQRQA